MTPLGNPTSLRVSETPKDYDRMECKPRGVKYRTVFGYECKKDGSAHMLQRAQRWYQARVGLGAEIVCVSNIPPF